MSDEYKLEFRENGQLREGFNFPKDPREPIKLHWRGQEIAFYTPDDFKQFIRLSAIVIAELSVRVEVPK